MSAGTGVRHSEYNPSKTDRLRLYQIWIIPEETGITPRYEQRRFDAAQGKQLVLSPDARDGSLKVYQDMELYRWALLKDEQSVHSDCRGTPRVDPGGQRRSDHQRYQSHHQRRFGHLGRAGYFGSCRQR